MVRHIYGFEFEDAIGHVDAPICCPRYLANVIYVAEKFGEPLFADKAESFLHSEASRLCEEDRANEVCDMLGAMHCLEHISLRMPSLIYKVALVIRRWSRTDKRVRTYFSEHRDVLLRLRHLK